MKKIDCHLHVMNHQPEALMALANAYGYDRYNVLGIPCMGQKLNNFECLMLKALDPARAFVFGGFTYEKGEKSDFRAQLDRMLQAGCDGVKLIETKPNLMRQIAVPLDGECFYDTFAALEEGQVPIIWHVGDPATFWDKDKAPAFAVQNGWCYLGPSFLPLGALYRQAENVLARHPNLKVCFAHFYFCGDDIAHGERLLKAYPNVRFDLTPGTEMYPQFMADREKWKAFFETYRQRILFGTDGTDDKGEADIYAHLSDLVKHFLEDANTFRVWDIQGKGLGLNRETLELIYAHNFEAFVGKTPKALNKKGICAMADAIRPSLSERETEALNGMLKALIPG